MLALLLLTLVMVLLAAAECAEQGREDLDQQVGVVIRHDRLKKMKE